MQITQIRLIPRNVASDGAVPSHRGLNKRAGGVKRWRSALIKGVVMSCGQPPKVRGNLLRRRSQGCLKLGVDLAQLAPVGGHPLQNHPGQRMFDPFLVLVIGKRPQGRGSGRECSVPSPE
jgi:hypothetical protein